MVLEEGKAPSALRGFVSGGERVVVLLWTSGDGGHAFLCRYHPTQGFRWVQREDLMGYKALSDGRSLDGTPLERTPLKPVLEELAHAVVAHCRAGHQLLPELQLLVDLLSPGDTLL
ncbi:MAG: hypothetical protein RMJ98_16560 [Myxococcales bacterium]|nr:hypothetical protein [Polyangiaceae bacterium]MDW8250908.1 hypothetical protein [Myxococcales bacterium]